MSYRDSSSEGIDSVMYFLRPFEVLHSLSFVIVRAFCIDVLERNFNRHSRIIVALWNQTKFNHVSSHLFVDFYFFLSDNFSGFIESSSSFESLFIEHFKDLLLSLSEKAFVSVLFIVNLPFLTDLPVFNRYILACIWLEIIFEGVAEDAIHVDVTHLSVRALILPA